MQFSEPELIICPSCFPDNPRQQAKAPAALHLLLLNSQVPCHLHQIPALKKNESDWNWLKGKYTIEQIQNPWGMQLWRRLPEEGQLLSGHEATQ